VLDAGDDRATVRDPGLGAPSHRRSPAGQVASSIFVGLQRAAAAVAFLTLTLLLAVHLAGPPLLGRTHRGHPDRSRPARAAYEAVTSGRPPRAAVVRGMTEREVSHLRDVARVFRWVEWVGIGSGAVLAAVVVAGLLAGPTGRLRLARDLRAAGAIQLLLLAAGGIAALVSPWLLMDLVHGLLFKRGSYRFSPDSRIITWYPPPFLTSMVITILVAVGAAALVVTAVGARGARRRDR